MSELRPNNKGQSLIFKVVFFLYLITSGVIFVIVGVYAEESGIVKGGAFGLITLIILVTSFVAIFHSKIFKYESEAYIQKAKKFIKVGKLGHAQEILSEILSHDPEHQEALELIRIIKLNNKLV